MLRIAMALTLVAIAVPAAAQDRYRPVTKLGVHKTESQPIKPSTQLNQVKNTNTQSMNQTMQALAAKAKTDQEASKANAAQIRNNSLAAKQAKIGKQGQAIRDGMKESQQKADQAMGAANQSMYSGVVGGTAQVGSGIAGTVNQAATGKMGAQPITNAAGNMKIDARSSSQSAKVKANQAQIQADATQRAADQANENVKNSRAHAQQVKDSIKKMIDQKSQMRPCPGC
jgi:hypothetical protein